MGLQWFHITCFLLLIQISFEATSTQSGTGKRGITFFKKRRTPGVFGLITQFVRETIQDANFAVRNITDTINTEFPRTTAQPGQNSTSNSTTGVRRLTISQVNDILGRNFRSLVRLFNSEFRIAVSDSRNNIQQYKKELKDAVRPYFREGAWSTTTTERTTTTS